jgi:signal transduction histidine kinase
MDATAQQATASDLGELTGDFSARSSWKAAIADLGQCALLSRDVDGLLRLAVGLLREILGVEYAKVLHQPAVGEPLVLVAGSGWQDDIQVGETTVPSDRNSQAGYTLLSNEPVFVEDLKRETRFAGPQLLLDHGVVSGISVVIQGRGDPYGVLGVHSTRQRRFTIDDGDYLRSFANILGGAIENRRSVEKVEQNARYETALAECAQTLLASSGEDRIQQALKALLTATEATYVFLERNVIDPELGLCSQTVAEADGPGSADFQLDNPYWDLVPWERMPTSRQHMEQGRPFVVIPELLEGPEYDQYAADPYPVKTELELPIFADGEWVGLIGLSDQYVQRHWSDTDILFLTTAAKMIGAFWEREADREQLRQLNQEKDAFLASVSHELRTPLTAVVGFGQILQDSANTMSEEERAELLELVVAQGTDLTNITNDLLVAAKADIGALEVTLVPVNLRAQTAQVLEAFERDQVAQIDLLGHSVRAVGDPDRVRQVVRNLISNALRYGGDTIRVEVLNGDTDAKVLVCDNGPAIPDEDHERIFQPYRRAHNAPGITDSLGLGLAISRQLAQLMGGNLTYRHQHGESIFELALPTST